MPPLDVDPDGLTAISEVARRQHDHVGRVSSYISSECSRFGAFSGVLNLFEGSYRSAVDAALGGMRDGQTIATKVQTTVRACREDYLETDRQAYDDMAKIYSALGGLPPYTPPGSGNSTPGGPLSAPPAPGEEPAEGDPFGLPELPDYVDGPAGRLLPSDDANNAGGLDPVGAAQERALERIRQEQLEQRYLENRAAGMTPEEARDAAERTVDADQQARERVDRTTRERTEDAYDRAHDEAKAQGRTDEEAREAGQDAARDQNRTDTEDTRRRRDIGDAAGTYKGAYDGVNEAVGGIQDLKDNIDELKESHDDLDEYDDYEDRPDDDSAQKWGRS